MTSKDLKGRGKRGKGKRKGEKRVGADEMVGAAMKLFLKKGFVATSMQNIATEVGVSQSAVMYYFPNRDALFLACIQRVQRSNWERTGKDFDPADDARVRMRKHFHANLAWALDAPEEALITVLFYSMAISNLEFAELNAAVFQAARQRILTILLAGRREGIFGSKIEATRASEILHDGLLAGILGWISMPPSSPTARAKGLTALREKWDQLISLVTA